jgi:hypothetical protein
MYSYITKGGYFIGSAHIDIIPEVFFVLDTVPSELLCVKVELRQVLLIASLTWIHLLAFRVIDRQYVGDFGHLVIVHAVQLTRYLAFVRLVGVA